MFKCISMSPRIAPLSTTVLLASLLFACSSGSVKESGTSVAQESIIGGSQAAVGAWPWQARIGISSSLLSCGGSLVAPDWVLTAAHCTFDGSGNDLTLNPGAYTITLGDRDISISESGEQVRSVDLVQRNPSYPSDPTVGHFDVALLHLSSPVTFNSTVAPIRPAVGDDSPGLPATATGWGWIDHVGDTSNILMQISTSTQTAATCNPSEVRNLYSDEICVGASDGSVGACHGDSGGALVTQRPGNSWEEIGVVSWGQPLCTTYSVFARVSSQVDWIRQYVFDVATQPGSDLVALL